MYYQVNATYYSALGEDDRRMLLARAIQLFMPGKPQVWYLDLFAGKNDYEGMKRAGRDGHKEINRTNLSLEDVQAGLQRPVVRDQLKLLRMRNTQDVFSETAAISAAADGSRLLLKWETEEKRAILNADLASSAFSIDIHEKDSGFSLFRFEQL